MLGPRQRCTVVSPAFIRLVPMATVPGYLPRLKSRGDFVDYLEGFIPPTVTEVEEGKPARKLVKTYMLETARHGHVTPDLAHVFPVHIELHRLDDSTLPRRVMERTAARSSGGLEALDERHPDRWIPRSHLTSV